MKLITIGADPVSPLRRFNPLWIVGGVAAALGGSLIYFKATEKSQMRKIRQKVFEVEVLKRKLGR